ncbi:MAG: element excision factor XisI family protein [Nostoc sp.]|uniref:element excision factor XisI family protein n=1 Tax=Nostoc sp. TaxID=1180 RepID=UPI002FF00626
MADSLFQYSYTALGQFLNYRDALDKIEPECQLYLAVRVPIYESFFRILHLDIKDGRIWIQHDGTEEGIANRLVEMGVPKQDIILAFHEPYVRQFTEFGT